MITLYHTPFQYRNTTRLLFKESIKVLSPQEGLPGYPKLLYLAPHAMKVKEAQRIFHNLVVEGSLGTSLQCYIPPRVETLIQFARRVYRTQRQKRVLPRSVAAILISRISGKGLGLSSLVADLLHDVVQHYPDKTMDEIEEMMKTALGGANISETVSRAALSHIETLTQYRRFLEEHDIADENEVLRCCPELIPALPPPVLVLDGFFDPTPCECALLEKLIKHAPHTFISLPYDRAFQTTVERFRNFLRGHFTMQEEYLKPDAFSAALQTDVPLVYSCYADREEEIEAIARKIKSLAISGRCQELEKVVVTMPSITPYKMIVERVFHRYGIPFESPSRIPTGDTRPFLDLIGLLQAVAEDYPKLLFSQALSSRHFRKIPKELREIIPSISVVSGIISGKESWLDFVENGSETIDMARMKGSATLKRGMERMFAALEPFSRHRISGTCSLFTKLLERLMDDLEFGSDEEGHRAQAEELIAAMAYAGDYVDQPISLSEYIALLRHVVNSMGAEQESAGVKVMEFHAAVGLSPDYLYFAGLVDGEIPGRQGLDYILPDAVRRKLGFLYFDRHIELQRFHFQHLMQSCSHIHLSYPLAESDSIFLPSSFLYLGREEKERIPGIFSHEEYLTREREVSLAETIHEMRNKPALVNLASHIRVTDIDRYRACPRKFFIEQVMKLQPLAVKEFEVEAFTTGTIAHKIMEHLIREPLSGFDQFARRARRIIEETVDEKRIAPYWKELMKESFTELLPAIYEREVEIRGDGYRSSEVERMLYGEPIQGIKLKGKIDRFDQFDDMVQIIDYKSGSAALSCSGLLEGKESLQLFLYAAIMKQQGYKVSRVGIYSLKDISIKWCPPRRRTKRTKTAGAQDTNGSLLDEYIVAALQFLEHAVNGMRKGDFSANPLEDYGCRTCFESPFCPYTQK